jgi:hypothetical protein
MAINSIRCVDEKEFMINFSGNPIVSGEYWLSINDLDLDKTERICLETTSNINEPGSSFSAITEYPSCYECVINNNGVIIFQQCFGKENVPLVINVSGLTEIEYNQFVNDFNSGFTGSYYIEYIDNSILKKGCFFFAKDFFYGAIATLPTDVYTQISTALQGQGSQIVNDLNYSATTSCQDCFKNVAVIYEVRNCITENVDYVYLPQGFPENYLISYTDGINEFCGTVQGQIAITTTTFTYVSSYGPFNAEEGCTQCLTNQNQKVRIENCSDNTDSYVVWASQLFDLGNATNIELRGRDGGCFNIVGETTDPVDNIFLDYEPFTGCTSCQTCIGVTYEYLDCDTLEVLGYFYTYEILNYGDSFLNPIEDKVYVVGNQSINESNSTLPSVLQVPCGGPIPSYRVWVAKECLTDNSYIVLTDNVVTSGDVVKLLYGENDFLCVTLIEVFEEGRSEQTFNSKRDGLGNTITYNDCTDCTDNSTFGVRTLDCDNQDLTIFDLNYTAYTQFFTIPTSAFALEARKPFPGPIRNPFSNTCFVDGNGDCRTVLELCPQPPSGNLITPSSTYFSCPDCRTFNPPNANSEDCINGFLRAVNYNSLPLIPGDACSVDVGLQYNICTTITDVNITGSTNLAITEYTNCYQCLADNQGVVEVTDCFSENSYTITIDGLGFLPEFGTSAYMTIEDVGSVKSITSCFQFGSVRQLTTGTYNQGITNGSILIPQPTPIQEFSCNTCLQNNLFTYSVARCTDDIIDYLNLPFGLNGSLISYSDGVNQYCGTVGSQTSELPGPYNFISNFGNQRCEVCLDVANDKILIQSCTNSDDTEIVWASALFQNGDVSNLSTEDGCFEVIGLTEDPVTLPYFLNFDPQPGCESCIECNGINYEYVTCNTFNGFDTGTDHLIQTPGANISCSEYSSGSNKIYLGYVFNSQIDVFDPVTNTVSTTISGSYNHRTNDIEYFNPTTLYTLSTYPNFPSTPTGNVNKIDSVTDTSTVVYTTSSYNYYMTTDVVNNRLFFTSYNTVSGFYQVNSFNTVTNTVTDTLTSSSGYYKIKYAPNVNKVYTLSGYYDVKVLNANDLSVITTLTFSNYLRDVEYNPCTEQIYVTTASNYYSPSVNGEIKVIDTVSDTVINTVSSYYRQNLIKYNPTDNKMYVTSSSYYSPNTFISVFNPQTNLLNGTYSVYPTIYNTQDFTFYPTDNELYLPFYSSFNGSSDYLVELPMTYSSYSSYFKSYQYIPNGDIFYNPYIGECCEVVGTSSSYSETLYSVQTYDDCASCNTCHGQVWVATGCGLSGDVTFNVTANNGAQIGDIVRLMWGSNGWICVELQSLYVPQPLTFSVSPTFYDSERDGLGNTIIYNGCTSCVSSDIGVTLVGCETGVEKYVSISVENYMNLNSLEGVTNFVINDSTGCYYVTNFCPIPLSATTEFTPVQFFAYCDFCIPSPDLPRSANTENFICIPDCEFTGSTAVAPPHPIWTDGYGRAVTQLNMVVLGGPNGLNG